MPHGWCKRLMLSMVLFTFTYCVLKKNKIPVSIGTTHIIVFFCVLLLLSRLLTSWCKSICLCLMAVARSDKMLSFFVQYFTSSKLSSLDFREKKVLVLSLWKASKTPKVGIEKTTCPLVGIKSQCVGRLLLSCETLPTFVQA